VKKKPMEGRKGEGRQSFQKAGNPINVNTEERAVSEASGNGKTYCTAYNRWSCVRGYFYVTAIYKEKAEFPPPQI